MVAVGKYVPNCVKYTLMSVAAHCGPGGALFFPIKIFQESITLVINFVTTVCDGDMVIDHPYAVFMSRSALLKKMLLPPW